MRDNWLSNRIFESYDDILDHCCFAWKKLIDMPWKIISIGTRDFPGLQRVPRDSSRRRAMTSGDTVPGRKPPRFSRRGSLSAVSACVSGVVMLPSSQPMGGGSLKPAPVGLAARRWENPT
jgi:hypothetical protein